MQTGRLTVGRNITMTLTLVLLFLRDPTLSPPHLRTEADPVSETLRYSEFRTQDKVQKFCTSEKCVVFIILAAAWETCGKVSSESSLSSMKNPLFQHLRSRRGIPISEGSHQNSLKTLFA
jgi:hypothetical protein